MISRESNASPRVRPITIAILAMGGEGGGVLIRTGSLILPNMVAIWRKRPRCLAWHRERARLFTTWNCFRKRR